MKTNNDENEGHKPVGEYSIISKSVLLDILDENILCKTCKKGVVKLLSNETQCISVDQFWTFCCHNSQCTSVFNKRDCALTPNKADVYEFNRIAVLGIPFDWERKEHCLNSFH